MYTNEVAERIKAINAILDQYNLTDNYFGYISGIAFLIIGIILTVTIGEFWGVILLILAALPLILSAKKSSYTSSEKELSQEVCCHMSFCVNVAKLKGKTIGIREQTEVQILHVNYNGNGKLYKEFIQYYPYMASHKLEKLASVKIGLY